MPPTQLLVWLGTLLAALALCQAFIATCQGLLKVAHYRALLRNEAAMMSVRLNHLRRGLEKKESRSPWNGTRKFWIERVTAECEGVKSFYLMAHDKRALSGFFPGQYLTFELDIPGERKRTTRCYSLSDRPGREYYRVTIKAVPSPPDTPGIRPGLVSNHFHQRLHEGDIVDVKAPSGGFHLDTERMSPVVLIAGGVGVTPMSAMLHYITTETPQRQAWLFYGVRNGSDHILHDELEALAKDNDQVHLHVCYSRPRHEDTVGKDYQHKGHVTLELLRSQLPSNNFEYYLCGPGQMMQDMHNGLLEWGVPKECIHLEAFGPASVKKSGPSVPAPPSVGLKVRFSRSDREIDWTGQVDSILDMALGADIPLDFGCRAGGCGSCKTAVKSGKVKYLKDPGCEVESGSCLTCICVPETSLELDA